VAAVIFNSGGGMRRRGTGVRTALVLGAGGVLGAAWMTGALASLADRLPCAAADVDLIVGTSAGSVFAAALRCHAGLPEMVAWQRGEATGILGESAALAAQDGPLPPLPQLRVGSVPLARAGLLRPLRVPPWVAASGWLPRGRGQHAALRSLVDALYLRGYPQDRSDKKSPAWADGLLHPGLVRTGPHRRAPLRRRRRAVRDLARRSFRIRTEPLSAVGRSRPHAA